MFKKNENQYEDFSEVQEREEQKRYERIQAIKDAIVIIAVVAIVVAIVWYDKNGGETNTESRGNDVVVTLDDCPANSEYMSLELAESEEERALLEGVEVAIAAANCYETMHPDMNEDQKAEYNKLVFSALREYSEYRQFCEKKHAADDLMPNENDTRSKSAEIPAPPDPVPVVDDSNSN